MRATKDGSVAAPPSPAGRSDGVTARKALIIAVVSFGFLVAIFLRMMSFDMRRDEELYATPAVLLNQYHLYSDFFYNHVPLSAWFFNGIFNLLGGGHVLFAARLGGFAGWIIFAVAVPIITFRLTRSLTMTVFATVVVLSNDLLLGPTGMAGTNNLLPFALAYLGLGLFLLGVMGEGRRWLLVGVGGFFLALGAATKANALGFVIPVAIAALFVPGNIGFLARFRTVMLPLAVGGILGALPVLYYLATEPSLFLAHIVKFHTGPHPAYWAAKNAVEPEVAMSLGAKVALAYAVWLSGANLFLLFAFALLAVLLIWGGTRHTWRLAANGANLLLLGAFLLMCALCFAPTPSFPQYYAPPIVAAVLLLATVYRNFDLPMRLRARPALVAASLIIVLLNLPRLAPSLPSVFSPHSWTVARVHRYGVAIADRLAQAGLDGKVATLAPIYPLEGGLPVYPELATGQFAYRSAPYTKPALARYYRAVSPDAIEGFLKDDPPAALLLGFEPELEAPMLRFANENGYLRADDLVVKDRYGNGVLYMRPGSLSGG